MQGDGAVEVLCTWDEGDRDIPALKKTASKKEKKGQNVQPQC